MHVYVGEKDGKPVTEPAKPVTIHHLLTHTSGLTYSFFGTPVAMMYMENGIASTVSENPAQGSLEELVKDLAKLPLIAQPGTEWNYGLNIDVLGRLVEVISGQTFGDFLRTRIFEPLEMHDTGFYVPDEKASRFANNYSPSPEGGMQVIDDTSRNSPFRTPPAIEFGGGGLVGTVGDYFHFAQMLANKGEFRGKRLLGAKTVEFMMSDHLPPDFPDDPLTSLFGFMTGKRAWGNGFGIAGSVVTDPAIYGLPVSQGLYGWGGAASTSFWVDLEEELVGIVHTQLVPDGTYPVRELMQLLTYQAIVD
jgi:CubicO group peptidase (beta-lactamase class C family)